MLVYGLTRCPVTAQKRVRASYTPQFMQSTITQISIFGLVRIYTTRWEPSSHHDYLSPHYEITVIGITDHGKPTFTAATKEEAEEVHKACVDCITLRNIVLPSTINKVPLTRRIKI